MVRRYHDQPMIFLLNRGFNREALCLPQSHPLHNYDSVQKGL